MSFLWQQSYAPERKHVPIYLRSKGSKRIDSLLTKYSIDVNQQIGSPKPLVVQPTCAFRICLACNFNTRAVLFMIVIKVVTIDWEAL